MWVFLDFGCIWSFLVSLVCCLLTTNALSFVIWVAFVWLLFVVDCLCVVWWFGVNVIAD